MKITPAAIPARDNPATDEPNRQQKSGERLKQACADFESILLDSMFQSMRKTLSGADIYGKSLGRDLYESLYYTQISKDLASRGNGIGLAAMLYQQLSQQIEKTEDHNTQLESAAKDQFQETSDSSDKEIDGQ